MNAERVATARRGLAWNRSAFVAGVLTLQAAKLFVAFAAARWLAPAEFASWNQLLLLVQYSTYAQLGVTMALNRDYAMLLGAGDAARARRLAGAALAVTLVTTVPFALVGASRIDVGDLWVYAAFAALPPLTALVLLSQALLRSTGAFRSLGALLAVEAAGWLVLVLPFIAWRASMGFVAAIDIVLLAVLIPYGRSVARNAFARFRFPDVRAVVGSGIPLAAAAGASTLRQTSDLLVALWRFDSSLFAGLAVSTIFVRALYLIPTLTNLLWLPDLARAFGTDGPAGAGRRARLLLRRYLPIATLTLLACTGAALLACETVLDQYRDYRLLVGTKVAAEGTVFLATVLTMYLSVVRRSRVVVAANLAGMTPYAVLLLLAEPTRSQLTGAIGASALIYIGVVVTGFLLVSRRLEAAPA